MFRAGDFHLDSWAGRSDSSEGALRTIEKVIPAISLISLPLSPSPREVFRECMIDKSSVSQISYKHKASTTTSFQPSKITSAEERCAFRLSYAKRKRQG